MKPDSGGGYEMRKIIYFLVMPALVSCATARRDAGWEGAAAVAEQRAIIEQQRQRIAGLERVIQSGAEHIRAAEERLGSLEDGNTDFEEWLRRVDEFVQSVIAEQRRLEGIQRTDRPADAGER
jgi:hypothetical protein